MTKIIAFYLPQFHTIPENDIWWGNGFTEWVNVRKAKQLYHKHYQPRIPFDEWYYDLSNVETLRKQAKWAQDYMVGGFCFYHYWFKGKKLLEKPTELLLKNTDIYLPFCFCWGNESWVRSWDGCEGENKILIKQEYGDEKEWEEHFMYLLSFFQDSRYIKKGGKPIFLIYSPLNLSNAHQLKECWTRLAVENGLSGVTFLEVHRNNPKSKEKIYDGIVDFEPFASLDICRECKANAKWYEFNKKRYKIFDYVKFTKKLTRMAALKKNNHYTGLFVGWDNTARKGKDVSMIFEGNKPQVFGERLRVLLKDSERRKKEFVFINAWNEWAEGTYLEPDTKYGFEYLNEIKKCMERMEHE